MPNQISIASQVVLRPETSEDKAFLSEVFATTREMEMQMVPWDMEQKATFLRMQFHAQYEHYHKHYYDADFCIVEVDGCPAGRLAVHRSSKEIRIVDIALLTEYRGKGVGGYLLQELMQESVDQNKALRIHVEKQNPARRLYDRLGFREVNDLGIYLLMEYCPSGIID